MTRSRGNLAGRKAVDRGPLEDTPKSAAEISLQHLLETYVRGNVGNHVFARISNTLEEAQRSTYGRGYVQGSRDERGL